jgi:hypothetical protein
MRPVSTTNNRSVFCTDGVAWLKSHVFLETDCVVTSLPDASEIPQLGFEGWRNWFIETSSLICSRIHPKSLAIFYQTDVKRDGLWVDKSYLVSRGAEATQSKCLFHKVVCRAPPGITTFGRPAYAHILAFSRHLRLEKSQASADVLPSLGEMTWARAMGLNASEAIAEFLKKHTPITRIIDPFCGHGTMLAVANKHGFEAIGVEISAKRAGKAQLLEL